MKQKTQIEDIIADYIKTYPNEDRMIHNPGNKKTYYTPGPWLDDGNGFEATWDVSNSERSICTVKTTRQDARLIAAAPELLEALTACRELLKIMSCKLGHITQGTDCDTLKVREVVRIALSKATGENL